MAWGAPKKPEEFKTLIEMDSYLQLKKSEKYPAVVVTTGMNDPRVLPWMPGKFAAKLQAYNASDKPIIFIPNYNSGHSSNSIDEGDREWADICAFAFWQTGHPEYQYQKPDSE